MTNEFDTRELQRHVRERLARSHSAKVAKTAVVFFYGIAFGVLLGVVFHICK